MPPKVTLRPAVPAEAEALSRLALRSKGHWGGRLSRAGVRRTGRWTIPSWSPLRGLDESQPAASEGLSGERTRWIGDSIRTGSEWGSSRPGVGRVGSGSGTLGKMPPLAMTLRPAVPADAPALSRLAWRSKAHWGYDDRFLAACREELTLQPGQCDGVHTVVAEGDAGPLGFYRLAGEPPVAELADLFVDPDAIGQGVGAVLLADAVGRARALGISRLLIDADPHAEGFYAHLGARRIGSVASGSLPGRELPRLELVVG